MDQAERIIARFGGIRPMAAKLGIAVTTVQGWKERGSIPTARHAQIIAAGEAEGLALTEEDLSASVASARPATARRRHDQPQSGSRETPAPEHIEQSEFAKPVEPEAPPVYEVRTRPVSSPARSALLGGLAGVIVAAGAGATGWYLGEREPAALSPAVSQRLAELGKRAEAAEAKIAGLAGLPTRLEAAEARARAIEEKITALSGLPARLKASHAVAEEAARALVSLKSELAQLAARLKASAPSEKLTAVEAGLAALKARIEELASGNQSASGKEALAALKSDLAGIKARLEANAREFASTLSGFDKRLAALGKRIDAPAQALGRRLGELEKRGLTAGGARGAALIAGIGQLRQAVRAGRPYASELEAVNALAGKEPGLAAPLQQLSGGAAKGVPTLASLISRFGTAAPAIVAAGRMPEKGSWAERAWARARSVVIVRRIGPGVKGADAEAVVARAEVRLAARDIAGAAALLKGLEGRAALAAAPWLAAALAHLEAARALRALQRTALARIGRAETPAEPKQKAAP